MDVRIGVTDHPREIGVTMPDDTDREALKTSVGDALAGTTSILWLSDAKGGEVAVPAAKIAFVEIGPESSSTIGFG